MSQQDLGGKSTFYEIFDHNGGIVAKNSNIWTGICAFSTNDYSLKTSGRAGKSGLEELAAQVVGER